MKKLIFALSLVISLFATPVLAQQGPAGVPGLFGLVDEVLPASSEKAAPIKHATPDNAPSPEALKACAGKKGKKLQQCLAYQEKVETCRAATEPARCLRFLKAHEVCQNKLGDEHLQCLRNILVPKK